MAPARSTTTTEATAPDTTVTVALALARAAAEVSHIGKDQTVTQGPARFNFRGIDDVLDTIHEPLTRHGVSIVPVDFDVVSTSERTTKSGGAQTHLLVKCHFRIYGPAGDHIPACALAEALDVSDKGASKAMAMAYKYVAIQAMSIPVRGLDESDRDSTERVPARPAIVPPATEEEFTTRLNAILAKLGIDIESFTAKFREGIDGGITLEQFSDVPLQQRAAFLAAAEEYAIGRGLA